MEIEILNFIQPVVSPENYKDSALLTFALPGLIETMKQSDKWSRGDLNARILLNSPDKQIILTVLHEKTEINSFQSKDSITLHIIEGKLKFQTHKDSVILNEGQLLTFRENVKYRLTTLEDTAFLLTISNNNPV